MDEPISGLDPVVLYVLSARLSAWLYTKKNVGD